MADSKIEKLEEKLIELASIQQEIAIATRNNSNNIETLAKDIKVIAEHSLSIAVMETRVKALEEKTNNCFATVKKITISLFIGSVVFVVGLVFKMAGLK